MMKRKPHSFYCLSHLDKYTDYFFDARFGFRLTVLTITEDASLLSSAKLISFSSFSEGIFVPSFSTKVILLHVYNICGASSQDGEELLLSIVAAPSCCLSVPSLNIVAYSDSNICLACWLGVGILRASANAFASKPSSRAIRAP